MLDAALWLSNSEGSRYLAQVAEWEESGKTSRFIAGKLRDALSVERARWVMEVHDCRQRAQRKFTLGRHMLLTRRSLEQSTSESIARYKATRFSPGASVADLCCGIGGDAIGLGAGRRLTAVDRDATCVHFARHNLDLHGLTDFEIHQGDVDIRSVRDCDLWHIDPDRRVEGRRRTSIDRLAPNREEIDNLLNANPEASLKLAPATVCPREWTTNCELEWMGDDRECKQQVAWFGATARHRGKRVATVVSSRFDRNESIVEIAGHASEIASSLETDTWVHESHAVVLAAGLLETVRFQFELRALAPGHALSTSSNHVESLLINSFQVIDRSAFRRQEIERMLERNDVGSVEIKSHGVDDSAISKGWKSKSGGKQSATLFLTRIGRNYTAILARRVSRMQEIPADDVTS